MRDNKILIVEDCDEIRTLIRKQLETCYKVFESATGAVGWETALREQPDLIITDVEMPQMCGLELCRQLKTDERTSHIPVIMVTAGDTQEQQAKGLESGADIYLTKPFNIQVLRNYISNLLRLREMLRRSYSRKIFLEPLAIEVGSVEQNFIEEVMKVIEARLGKVNFNITGLARDMGMSKAAFYKKFNASTTISPGQLIKSMRLKKAAMLLSQEKGNITTIAWEVGFSERKYFSKEFKKRFGKSPSEYVAGVKNNTHTPVNFEILL
ncbi:response regulator [Chitinophaga sp. 22321]|uniref:Response regulator n=1 Tax=Chitinophaga hostae TaxID=2831022 RepID=A0ABS5IZQ2_9BACT|nr:response regulator [Chitinophaga hostae]MBS0028318.1 response regulator [Chitinophaga hostae]